MSILTVKPKPIPAWDIPAQQMTAAAERLGSGSVVGVIRHAVNMDPDTKDEQRYEEVPVSAYLTSRGWRFSCHLVSGRQPARYLISWIPGRPTFRAA